MGESHNKQYTFEYEYDGCAWGIDIWARSEEDAKEKIKAISQARYLGRVFDTIPIPCEN